MTSQPSSRETSVDQPAVRHVCLYFPSYGDGGVENMTVNFAHGLSDAGIKVDFIVPQLTVPYRSGLEQKVKFITPPTNKSQHLSWLIRYLISSHPDVLVSLKQEANITAIKAKQRSRTETKIVVRTGAALLSHFALRGTIFLKRRHKSCRLKHYYQQADGHIAVALGTRKELHELIQIPEEAITVINNPVITPGLLLPAIP